MKVQIDCYKPFLLLCVCFLSQSGLVVKVKIDCYKPFASATKIVTSFSPLSSAYSQEQFHSKGQNILLQTFAAVSLFPRST